MSDEEQGAVEHRVVEPARTPALSLLLGHGAIVPLALGAVGAWSLPEAAGDLAVRGSILWGAVILIFLAGVRRGLSFRTVRGPTCPQIATMLWLFGLGLLAVILGSEVPALLVLLMGYGSLAVLDPAAARRGEVPLFFERLRPWQMGIAVVSLGAVLAGVLLRP